MRTVFVISLLVAAVVAGNWNVNDVNNRKQLTDRDAKHQKFILDLLNHLQQDIQNKDFLQYSNTIRLDNKNDYKDLNKVYHVVTLFQNGWFLQRNKAFSLFRERNIITTKALFDFFDTMQDWNTCAMNLIWARRNINEYQFWHLMSLLVTHNRHFDNLVLPAFYEVFPTQFYTGDVMDMAMNLQLTNGNKNNGYKYNNQNKNGGKQLIIMSNYTTGVLGSNDNDDNSNTFDLNNVGNKINDWNTVKQVMYKIKNQMQNKGNQNLNQKNKDQTNTIWNNNRQQNQGKKFDNNGEDRMVYFTEDVGLNNYYYFSRIGNSRIVDNNQMYKNVNNKETLNKVTGQFYNNDLNDKIHRRGERYVYQMKQLLARFNLERQCNGLDNVQDQSIDGVIDNGAYPNLRYTNGLQMQNRQNDFNLKKQQNMRLIQVTKDFENRFYRAIDQGFVLTENGNKVSLKNKDGINILGNLLQGNRNSVNNDYYRYLEYYYRLLFGGNNNDNIDFEDNRFMPTVLDHYETSMRDSVFWKIIKKITNIVNKFQNKLTGYTTNDVNFNGVKINNVKVDKMITTFNYFDTDLSNGITMKKNRGGNNNQNSDSSNDSSDSNSNSNSNSNSDSSSSSESNSNESGNNGNKYIRGNQMNKNLNNKNLINKNVNGNNKYVNKNNRNMNNRNLNNQGSSSSESNSNDSSDSNSSSNSNESNNNVKFNNKYGKNNGRLNGNRNGNSNVNGKFNVHNKNYRNSNRNMGHNNNYNGNSQQVNYWQRNLNSKLLPNSFSHWFLRDFEEITLIPNLCAGALLIGFNNIYVSSTDLNNNNMNIVGRTRRMDTKQFTVTIDVQSNQNQDGIVRIFLGPRINNQQQLNDNRNNFVELDQFIVQLNNGQNIIKRNSVDFKNVVGDAQTMGQLYQRTLNTLNGKNGNGNNMNNLNLDTCNNNQGFPHRLLLPKGTTGGEDYTLFVVINNVKTNGFNHVQYHDDLITGNKHQNNGNNQNSNSNGSSDSNSSSNESNNSSNDSGNSSNDSNNSSNESNNNGRNNNGRNNGNNGRNNGNNNGHKNMHNMNGNNNGYNNMIGNNNGNNKNMNNKNWGKNNGVKIFNLNNGNKNVGNGNGVLDNRAMGFPLDRQIIDVSGFITKNMFFKNVVVYHIDNSMNNNQNNGKINN